MKFPLQCFSKVITGNTGLLTAPDSVQGGVEGRDRPCSPDTPPCPCFCFFSLIIVTDT
ncbi:hypothetical protein HanXRQr2_Chr01g0045241 [Helianthus annuus]|uniref:Uncharacterized protein n=1 Tax=Helianthus annuus TaxID=4232 RepID=A0A9K3JZ89_HELAN|nr:hypothetical protein HanXRQr2_Chr01g0045241 [Helianthus annuus]KAJ0958990.1 hypothetical protein HanPSC8_Chr01g0044961 [Helianthus annuus]